MLAFHCCYNHGSVTDNLFQYKHTSLEGNYKHELHTEADLGLEIDLISMDCDNDAEVSNFNEVDEKLLEDEVSTIILFSALIKLPSSSACM